MQRPSIGTVTFDIPEVEDQGSAPTSPILAPVKPVTTISAPSRRKSMLIRRNTSLKSSGKELSRDEGQPPSSLTSHFSASASTTDTSGAPALSCNTPSKHGPTTVVGASTPPSHTLVAPQVSTISISQSNPTALPNELLELIREFRVRIEKVAAFVNTGESNAAAQSLHHSGNDIIRYVTNFLIQKHEEEVRYEQKKLVGWAAASHIRVDEGGRLIHDGNPSAASRVDPSVLGPFLLTALYGIMESLLLTLKCDRARIFLPDGGCLRAVVSVGGGAVMAPEKAEWDRVAGSVFRSGVAINVGDTNKAPSQYTSSADDTRQGYLPRSILCLPLFDNLNGDDARRPTVIGVVEFLNKARTAAFSNGFSDKDEDAAHHYAFLISNLIRWGSTVDFCSQTSLEEGAKVQALLLAQRHFVNSQWRLFSTAGSRNISRTEASTMIQKQTRKEEMIRSRMDEGLRSMNFHTFLVSADRQQQQQTSLIFRVACANERDAVFGDASHPTTFVASEALSVIRNGGNVRELVQMLEQFDASWKGARHKCIALERRVEMLEAALRCEQGNTRALRQLCVSCGITPPPSSSHHVESLNFKSPTAAATVLQNIGPELMENGTLDQTIETHHSQIMRLLKHASSQATNLGRRLQATAEATLPAANPTKSQCEARLESLLRKVELHDSSGKHAPKHF